MKTLITCLGLALLLGAVTACDDESAPVADEPLAVTITASATTVSAAEPVTLTITITNNGDEQVEWGTGSSSCRLFASVDVDGVPHTIPPGEVCTADMVTYTLDPGESDTQTKIWDASVGVDGGFMDLPAGQYEVHGFGGKLNSSKLTLTVVKP